MASKQNYSEEEVQINPSKTTDELLLMILSKMSQMEKNYQNLLEKMMEKYMHKLNFLEREMLKLELLVRKSIKETKEEKPQILYVQEDEDLSETVVEISHSESTKLEEYIDESMDVPEATQEKSVDFEENIPYEKPDHSTLDEDKNNASENIVYLIPKKRRITNPNPRPNLDCMLVMPVKTQNDLFFLENLLRTKDAERTGFVEYLRNTKFLTSFKNAFLEIISEELLLEYNYNGKGATKKPLNDFIIFKDLIFEAFCQDVGDPYERDRVLIETKKIIRNSHNTMNKNMRRHTK